MVSGRVTSYDEAVAAVRERSNHQPRVGLVLGSGLGGLADVLEQRDVIDSRELPGWPQSTVEGHSGNLVLGKLEGQTVVAQQGRVHFYEGYSPQQITFPVRVMIRLGIEILVLTNAAGGLRPEWQTGDLMLINDHINLTGMTGANPLMGPNDESFGPRFPGMSQAYDLELRQRAQQVAAENRYHVARGRLRLPLWPQLRDAGGDSHVARLWAPTQSACPPRTRWWWPDTPGFA